MDELVKLEAAVGWSREDAGWLLAAGSTPAKKNRTDGGPTEPIVPRRYLIGFTAGVITSARGVPGATGRPQLEIDLIRLYFRLNGVELGKTFRAEK